VYTVAGQYEAKLIVTDTPGCAVAAAAGTEIDVHTPPVVGVTPPEAAICSGGIGETLTAIGGVTYSWSPPTGLSATDVAAPVATPLVSTTYTVTVADGLGCSNSGTVAVKVIRPEKLSVSPDSVALCAGKTVELVASGTDEYNWIGAVGGLSATDIANPLARPPGSMLYTVTGGDTHSCFSDTAFVIVNVLPVPAVNAGPDLVVQGGTPETIEAEASSDVVGWQWTPALYLSCTDCAQPVCVPKQTVSYVVTVTSVDGCTSAATVVVQLLCEESKVRIPDAFTPNGDGHNDRWNILGISQVNHLVIYDRWGVKVFERNHFFPADVGAGWDGTMNGQPAPPGVYAYFVEMQCATGGVFTRKGTVVLVR
jgi:gliding motility-associated-like protein